MKQEKPTRKSMDGVQRQPRRAQSSPLNAERFTLNAERVLLKMEHAVLLFGAVAILVLSLGFGGPLLLPEQAQTRQATAQASYPVVSPSTPTVSTFGTASTTHNVGMPGTAAAGDLLLVFFESSYSSSPTVNPPSGWTSLATAENGVRATVLAKRAVGGESGTINFSTTSSAQALVHAYRIQTGTWEGSIAGGVSISSGATGSNEANPPSVNAPWGSDSNLFFVMAVIDNDGEGVNSYPSGYGNGRYDEINATNDHSLATARRELTAASNDPGSFDFSGVDSGDSWAAFTLVIRPAAAGPVLPTLSSPTHSSITDNSAVLGATITGDGGAAITQRGTCWGTTANPTGNCAAASGTGLGAFSHNRTGLPAATLIHYRGYADNSAGRGYSTPSGGPFTTLAAPTPPNVDLDGYATAGPAGDGPLSISSGGSVTLEWGATGGVTCTASGGWSGTKNVAGGTQVISNVTANTTFALDCTNPQGSDNDSFAVSVLAVSLGANPASGTVPLNNVSLTATLTGTASGTFRYFFDCTNDGPNELDVTNSTNPFTASSLCSYPTAASYTARVTVWHSQGIAQATTTVTVNSPAPVAPDAGIVADTPDPVNAGQAVTFTLPFTDPNVGDTFTLAVCKNNTPPAAPPATCSGGPAQTWAPGTANDPPQITAQFVTTTDMSGSYGYYAFLCDDDDGCAAADNNGSNPTFGVVVPPPVVTTLPADPVGETSATLRGVVSGVGTVTVWFRYWPGTPGGGCGAAGGTQIPVSGIPTNPDTVSFSNNLTGLTKGDTYTYCAFAQNSGGTADGGAQSFTPTLGPTVGPVTANESVTGAPTVLSFDNSYRSATNIDRSIPGELTIEEITPGPPDDYYGNGRLTSRVIDTRAANGVALKGITWEGDLPNSGSPPMFALNGAAYNTNTDLIAMNCSEISSSCVAAGDWGVIIDAATGIYSGWAWSPVIGWISFNSVTNPAAMAAYNVYDQAVAPDRANVRGWAWSSVAGWISFDCTTSGTCGNWDDGAGLDGDPGDDSVWVDNTGDYHGWAWSPTVGWISFDCGNTANAAYNCNSGDGGPAFYQVTRTNSGGAARVRFWLASSACPNGETNPPDCTTPGTWEFRDASCAVDGLLPFEAAGGDDGTIALSAQCFGQHWNKRFLRYRAELCSFNDCISDGNSLTPTVRNVSLDWLY